jgi:PAS domain S-box-containing protein
MKDIYKSKKQLLDELAEKRKLIANLEPFENHLLLAKEVGEKKDWFLKDILNIIQDGISILDRELNIIYVNPTMAKRLDHQMPVVGKKCYKVFHELTEPCKICPAVKTLANGEPSEQIVPFNGKEGDTGWMELFTFPFLDAKTFQMVGVIEYVRDVTERKHAEKDLNLFRNLINQSNDAIFVIDAETGRFLDVNETTCKNLGYRREDLLTMSVMDIEAVIPDRPSWNKHVQEMKSKGHMLMEGKHLRNDGTTFPVEVNVKYVSQDEKDYMIAVVRDMTRRKDLESQFLQAQKMEAIGRFAGGITHDFNNLITAIIGHSELLLHDHNPGDLGYDNIRTIRETAERAAHLAGQLLGFSRKQVLEPIEVNLNKIVQDASTMFTRLAGEDIEHHIVLDPNLKQVKADPGQIEQVILNLVVNAREAMPKGGKLTISTGQQYMDETTCQYHPGVKPGEYAVLSVTDYGTGMREEVKEKIFDPYFTTKPEGTGLGLSTVYAIIKGLGGHIDVHSKVGKGSIFKVYLPTLVREETEEMETSVQSLEETLPCGHETILVIDDEPAILRISDRVLSRLGYTVLPAGREHEAYAKIRKHRGKIALLLTDVILPGKYGTEIAEELKMEYPELKVLFISGYIDDRIPLIKQGAHFLPKPFTPKELAQKVREVLDS